MFKLQKSIFVGAGVISCVLAPSFVLAQEDMGASGSTAVTLAEQGRLQGTFTLLYEEKVRDVSSLRMREGKVAAMRVGILEAAKGNGSSSADVQKELQYVTADILKPKDRQIQMTLRGKSGRLLFERKETSATPRNPPMTALFDGKKTFTFDAPPLENASAHSGMAFAKLIEFPIICVGMPGIDLIKDLYPTKVSGQYRGVVAMPNVSKTGDGKAVYAPALVYVVIDAGKPKIARIVFTDKSGQPTNIRYEFAAHRLLNGVWIPGKYTRYDSEVTDPKDLGTITTVHEVVLKEAKQEVGTTSFDAIDYLRPNVIVQDNEDGKHVSYHYVSGASLTELRKIALKRDEQLAGANIKDESRRQNTSGIALLVLMGVGGACWFLKDHFRKAKS